MTDARPVPADFDDFWRGLAALAFEVAPETVRSPTDDPRVELVGFNSVGGVRLGGVLVLPDGDVGSAVVNGHGYGGRSMLEPERAPRDAAVLYPVARGLPELSLMDDIPSTGAHHVLHGIGSRETYVHGGCAADLVWCAVSALEELLDRPVGERRGGLRLGYFGASFGGGIGAMAVPWDERVDAVALHVPSFGANPARLSVPCVGSGDSLSAWVRRHPEAWDVLDYFDAATAAARLRVPTIIAPANEDPAVPPVGQWAIAEAVPEQYRTVIPLAAGHVLEYPEGTAEMARLDTAVRELFAGDRSTARA